VVLAVAVMAPPVEVDLYPGLAQLILVVAVVVEVTIT
jgi:hypothetical protein